jgi:hypothetical protein
MHKFMDDIGPIVVFLGCLALLLLGIDSEVKGVLAVSAGWICGKGYGNLRAGGGKNGSGKTG